jgi:hypothetical protein
MGEMRRNRTFPRRPGAGSFDRSIRDPGGIVRLKDIARAELGSKSADSLVRYNGRPGEAIAIYQSPGANAIAVAGGSRRHSKKLSPVSPRMSPGHPRPDPLLSLNHDSLTRLHAFIDNASSTTIRIARTSASSDIVLAEKPSANMTANVKPRRGLPNLGSLVKLTGLASCWTAAVTLITLIATIRAILPLNNERK